MQITINSKFEIGQEVFIFKTDIKFKEGYFINVNTPDPNPYIITSIRIHQYSGYQSIYYRLDGIQKSIREDQVFSSIEEVQKYCHEL